jgi:hypothetical protein
MCVAIGSDSMARSEFESFKGLCSSGSHRGRILLCQYIVPLWVGVFVYASVGILTNTTSLFGLEV